MPDPYRIPPVRTPLEMEASLLDSDVQGPLGTEELVGDEPTGGPQLQWVSECREVTRAQLFRDSTDSGWCGGIFAAHAKAVARVWIWGGRVAKSSFPDGLSGVAHPSNSCAAVFIEVAADLEGSWISSQKFQREICPILTRRTATTHTVDGPTCCMGRENSGVDEGCVLSTPGIAEEEHASLNLPVTKARSAKKAAKRPKRDRGSASEALVPSRIPGNGARSR